MTRWINPVNVYFIQPVRKLPEETSVQFSERVKQLISETAGLKNLSWDGYLKNYRPTREKQDKMRLETRQEYLKELFTKLPPVEQDGDNGDDEFSPVLPERDYLPDWLSDDEKMTVQNALLQGNHRPYSPLQSKFDQKLSTSRESLDKKLKELKETIRLRK